MITTFRTTTRILDVNGNLITTTNPFPVKYPPLVSTNNSTSTPLTAGSSFSGTYEQTNGYGIGYVNIYSDKASATDGLQIFQSSDGVNDDHCDEYTIPAATGKQFSINLHAKYLKIVYTNGPADQTEFRLQTIFKNTGKSSSHRIQDTIIGDDDAELIKGVLTGKSRITDNFENVSTYKETLQVDTALVHEKGINQHIYQESGASTTFAVAASAGDTSITVADATGISIGDSIIFRNTTYQSTHHYDVTNVSGTTVTLNRPIDNDYIIGDSVIEIIYEMNVSGTLASPQSFKLEPLSTDRYQITRLIITMLDSTAMDDSLFGGLTALTNGVVIRSYIDSEYRTYTHWQSNNNIKNDMFDVEYASKAPAGQFGLTGRWTFTKAEFVVDIDGANGDYLEVLVQDDLTGLDSFTIKAQGRLFGG